MHCNSGYETLCCAAGVLHNLDAKNRTLAIGLEDPVAALSAEETRVKKLMEPLLNCPENYRYVQVTGSAPTVWVQKGDHAEEHEPLQCSTCSAELYCSFFACEGCENNNLNPAQIQCIECLVGIPRGNGGSNSSEFHVVHEQIMPRNESGEPPSKRPKETDCNGCVPCSTCQECVKCKCRCHQHYVYNKATFRGLTIEDISKQLYEHKVSVVVENRGDMAFSYPEDVPTKNLCLSGCNYLMVALNVVYGLPGIVGRLRFLRAEGLLLTCHAWNLDPLPSPREKISRLEMLLIQSSATSTPSTLLEWCKGLWRASPEEPRDKAASTYTNRKGLCPPARVIDDVLLSFVGLDQDMEKAKKVAGLEFCGKTVGKFFTRFNVEMKCDNCDTKCVLIHNAAVVKAFMEDSTTENRPEATVQAIRSGLLSLLKPAGTVFCEKQCDSCGKPTKHSGEADGADSLPEHLVIDVSDLNGLGLRERLDLMAQEVTVAVDGDQENVQSKLVAAICKRSEVGETGENTELGETADQYALEMVAVVAEEGISVGDYIRRHENDGVTVLQAHDKESLDAETIDDRYQAHVLVYSRSAAQPSG